MMAMVQKASAACGMVEKSNRIARCRFRDRLFKSSPFPEARSARYSGTTAPELVRHIACCTMGHRRKERGSSFSHARFTAVRNSSHVGSEAIFDSSESPPSIRRPVPSHARSAEAERGRRAASPKNRPRILCHLINCQRSVPIIQQHLCKKRRANQSERLLLNKVTLPTESFIWYPSARSNFACPPSAGIIASRDAMFVGPQIIP